MHEFVSFDQKICRLGEPSVSAAASAALYGKGVFTSVAVFDAQPFLWEKHWRRLNANAEKLGIDLSEFSEETVKNALIRIIEKNGCRRGRARITFFDETASAIWPFINTKKMSLLIATADFKGAPDNLRLTISPFQINSTSPLAGVKSCNYLEQILALDEARRCGFDEAIRLNERGEITSVCMANLFWLTNGKLFTPSLKTGCLAGTTRSFLMEKFACTELECGAGALEKAEAIFLTSAGIGIAAASEFGGRKFDNKKIECREILQAIAKNS